MKKLAIVITHPIQYYVPVFQLLAKHCELKVFYSWGEDCLGPKYDPGFGKVINWDIPLLEGYDYTFLNNTSKNKGSHHKNGIINPDIINEIETYKPDAVLVYGWLYHSHRQVLNHFKNKITVWFRGDSTLLDNQKGIKNWLKKIYLTHLYRKIDKAFYVGTNNKAYFNEYGLKEEQLIFAPHAIDNERFAEDRILESAILRESIGVDKEDILILFAGKLESKKNPELLLEAFVQLDKQNNTDFSTSLEMKKSRKVHLLFVGNGVLEERLSTSTKLSVTSTEQNVSSTKHNVSLAELSVTSTKLSVATGDTANKKRVHFMDFQNQSYMPVVYQACDIFCLPSQGPGETWGLAINEAMACGKVILASDKVGCAIDLVQPGINGMIFKADDLMDLTKQLKALLDSDLTQLGENSKKRIAEWTFKKQVKAILKELNKC
jgi:glycosyltransferase involved in cell wall biosynthesis